MLGIDRHRSYSVPKVVGADSAAAMPHPRNHEQPVKILLLGRVASWVRILPQKRADALVVLDGTDRRDGGVTPAVILNEFSTMRAERPQVGTGGVENRPGLFVAERHIAIEFQRSKIPLGLFEHRLTV